VYMWVCNVQMGACVGFVMFICVYIWDL